MSEEDVAERNVALLRPIYEQWGKGKRRHRPEVYAEDRACGSRAPKPC